MKKFFDKPWFYRIVALILAILLAIYVSSNQQGFVTQGRREETLKTATKTQVIKAPLQVSVNTDKYYVTGYPEKINLTLEGSNALVTSTINTLFVQEGYEIFFFECLRALYLDSHYKLTEYLNHLP